MMRQIVNVNWRYIGDAVPAFVTVMFIPFGYSAAYGLIAGLLTYTTLNGLIYITKILSRGLVVPDDEDNREYWTGKLPVMCPVAQYPRLTFLSSQTTRQTSLVLYRWSGRGDSIRV